MLGFIFGVIVFLLILGFLGTLFLLGVYKLITFGMDDKDTSENDTWNKDQ